MMSALSLRGRDYKRLCEFNSIGSAQGEERYINLCGRHMYRPRPQPPENANHNVEALGGNQVFFPFTILLCGITFSTIFAVQERVAKWLRKLRMFDNDQTMYTM